MADLIEIEVGTDPEGKPLKVSVPKVFKDEDGKEYNGQNIIDQLNGKIKTVTEAKLSKKYEDRIKELETIKERTKNMISTEDAQKLQEEINELRINQLPEREQEIERLRLQTQAKEKDISTWKTTAEQNDQKYKGYRISQELLLALPSGANGVIDDIKGDQVEIIKKYASINDKDQLVMSNIFEQGGDPIDVKTFMEKYYADPTRAAYLKSSIISGQGTQQARNLGGKQSFTSAEWQNKLASSKHEDRITLTRQMAQGEIVIKD